MLSGGLREDWLLGWVGGSGFTEKLSLGVRCLPSGLARENSQGKSPEGSSQEYWGLPGTLPILLLKVSNPGKLLNPRQTKTVGHSTMG